MWAHAEDHIIFNLVMHWSHTVVFSVWTTCNYTQLYPFGMHLNFISSRACHQESTNHSVLILLSESLGIWHTLVITLVYYWLRCTYKKAIFLLNKNKRSTITHITIIEYLLWRASWFSSYICFHDDIFWWINLPDFTSNIVKILNKLY